MLSPLTPEGIPAFTRACARERIFGSKVLTALRAHGLESGDYRFWHCGDETALCLSGGVLVLSAADGFPMESVAQLTRQERACEVDTTLLHAQALQRELGGTLETSFFMEYRGGMPEASAAVMAQGQLPVVFDLLQRSHEYYRTHLSYPSWSEGLLRQQSLGLSEVWQMEVNGEAVGTGSVLSEDEECGVVGAVAVPPECRHRGYATEISRFLTARILQKGKTPRLISGYDAVAALYRRIGYVEYGRWGELYL